MERLARNYPFALCSSYFSKPEGGSRKHRPMSVAGPFSDLGARSCEVRFTPMSRPRQLNRFRSKSATGRLTHLSNLQTIRSTHRLGQATEGSETECLGGLEVDRQFELYWGLIGSSPTLSPLRMRYRPPRGGTYPTDRCRLSSPRY